MPPRRRAHGQRHADPAEHRLTAAASPQATQWVYGRHAVTAALANPLRVVLRFLCLRENIEEAATLLAAARAAERPARPEPIERRALEALLPREAVHQGLALEAKPLAAADLDDVLAALPAAGAPHILLLLDQVSDPHNVGAILRSAAAFAALAVIVPEHGAPPVTGALAKAASGALETVPLVRVTNLARTIERLKADGFWCVGLDSEAQESLSALALPERIALVLGAEGAGLRRLVREQCDYLARLPTRGALHSLNVSNAAAVALYALTQCSR
ncbi:MAG TPA: 23S rRNA (guanosine(2251)-2'-O)-methyltransferase RlmB [Stellaceae bacterium]|jgi:23S rRNA (guanosine2251-2'-O)-methyltransferase|nr:23S rRNA (guanosine(2251)-2'-O)-methyltransferase RlmB [Stellaceae bacterium]